MTKTRESFVKTPGGSIFVKVWEPTEQNAAEVSAPIVLFHDSLGCVELWRDFPAVLAAQTGRKVFAYDRLGYGRSDAKDTLPAISFIRDEAEISLPYLLEAFALHRFIAFGHSVGGGMAVYGARKFADRCIAVITESAQAFVEEKTTRSIRQAKLEFQAPDQFERLNKYHGDKTRWVLDAWTETWLSPAFSSWSLESVLPEVRCPLLAIHGSEDEYGSVRHPKMIAGLAGGAASLSILEGYKHVPHRERPEVVAKLTADFLGQANVP
jgi:pimeloyl-ACP methyl ester carboxylesterase